MSLVERIQAARKRLRDGSLGNEASVSHGVVLPIIDALGWSAFDPQKVYPEYKVEGRRVDFALLTRGQPAVFVEVKQPGMAGQADRQLFEYTFIAGAPIAILTDGATWHFYLPAMQGSYDDRRVYLLDILERDPDDSAARLQRYLSRDAVESGEAFERARADYNRARQRKGAEAAIPQAWANLVAEPRLADLLAAEVESVCGFQPESSDLETFLGSLRPNNRDLPPPRPPRPQPASGPEHDQTGHRGFTLDGVFYPGQTGRHVMAGVLRALAARDVTFYDRFIATPVHGRRRRYLARSPEDLYPGRPDIVAGNVTEIAPGIFLGTHYSYNGMVRIIRQACELAGVAFGSELTVRFD